MSNLSEEWRRRWPNHCPRCLGVGAYMFTQSHPYGSTYATETLCDPCGECEGRCPRCGAEQPDDWDGERCAACEWTMDGPDCQCPVEENYP